MATSVFQGVPVTKVPRGLHSRSQTFEVVEATVLLLVEEPDPHVDAILQPHEHIRWACPACGEAGELCTDEMPVTEYFSVVCNKDGKLFLVHILPEVH